MPRLQPAEFESLVHEHHAAVFRSAFRQLRDPATAADVAQDVFVRVLEGKVRLAAALSVRATLCWLATRLAGNARRAQRRRSTHEENAMFARSTETRADDPAHASADHDLHHAVQLLVGRLPFDLQVALQMRCQDDLSFAAIGASLRLPASTVHDRVERALRQLRTALAGRGFAVTLAGLPDIVAASETIVAPVDLQARLLALPEQAAVGVFGIGKMALAGVAVVAVGGLAALAATFAGSIGATPIAETGLVAGVYDADPSAQPSPQDPPAVAAASAPDRDLANETTVVTGGGLLQQGPGSVDLSIVHGTVHDAAAWPVAGVEVHAVAAGGLKAFALGATVTDQHGAFRLAVDSSALRPSHIRLRIVETGNLLLETEEYALPRATSAAPLALVLAADTGTATSRYELHVSVQGDDGQPLGALPIQLVPERQPPVRFGSGPPEASGTTGVDGRVVLTGRSLGRKCLLVDGRPIGRRSHVIAVAVDHAGLHRTTVSLAAGRTLDGRIDTVDGTPVPWANVWLEDDTTGQQHTSELAGDGSVAFTGLGDGTYTLHVSSAWQLSPCQRPSLRAADRTFEVRLKQRYDQRDIGDHMAELHGELVDALTGAVVTFTGFQVDVLPGRAGESTLASDRILPRAPAQQFESGDVMSGFCEVGLTAGLWTLIADVPGYATTVVDLDLHAGEMRTGLRVPLHRGGEVRGRVVHADGTPAAKAHVFLVGTGALADAILSQWQTLAPADRDRLPDPSHLTCAAWCAADGTFRLSDVPAGTALRLVARGRDGGFAVLPLPGVASGRQTAGLEVRLGQP